MSLLSNWDDDYLRYVKDPSYSRSSLFGINVVENSTFRQPKIKFNQDFLPIKSEKIDEFNMWLEEMFGVKDDIYFIPSLNMAVISPQNIVKLSNCS